MLLNNTEIESTMIMVWRGIMVLWYDVSKYNEQHLNCILNVWTEDVYLPSPPQAPFGVMNTSLQRSLCVLYTSSFSALPSDASISEKKSSHCENPQRVISYQSEHLHERLMNRSYLLQHLVCTNNVVRIRLQSSQFSRRLHFHVLTRHARDMTSNKTCLHFNLKRKIFFFLCFKSILIYLCIYFWKQDLS